MRISLRLKMIGATVVLLVFIVAVFGILQLRLSTGEVNAEIERLRTLRTNQAVDVGSRTATSVASGSEFAIADNDFGSLQDRLRPTVEESGMDLPVLEAVVTDAQGKVLAFASKSGDKTPTVDLEPETLKQFESPESEMIEGDDGVPARVISTAPIVDRNGKVWGYVRLVFDLVGLRSDLDALEVMSAERKQTLIERAALVGILATILGIIIAILQALAITRPLEELTGYASRFAEGEIDARVPERGRDEIGMLAGAFNNMADRLRILLVDTAAKTAMERELEVARIIQETLLPPRGLVSSGSMKLSGYLESASLCGGDFWSHAELEGERTLVCIGDVTGHGVPSAMITAACKSGLDTLRSVTRGQFRVAALLDELNKTIYEAAQRKFTMTFFAVIIDRETGRMEIANAGHNFPILVKRENGEVTSKALVCRGNRLGDRRESRYAAVEASLQPGDTLCLYTDGITEYRNAKGQEFGERRLRRILHASVDLPPDRIIEDVVAAVKAFAGDSVQEDDLTIVIARLGGSK